MESHFKKTDYLGDQNVFHNVGWRMDFDISNEAYSGNYDATIHAQKIISAILRINIIGEVKIVDLIDVNNILLGKKVSSIPFHKKVNEKINEIKTFGAERGTDYFLIDTVWDELERLNAVKFDRIGEGFACTKNAPYLHSRSAWEGILKGKLSVSINPSLIRKREFQININELKRTIMYEEGDIKGRFKGWEFHEATDERIKRANHFYNKIIGHTSAVRHLISNLSLRPEPK